MKSLTTTALAMAVVLSSTGIACAQSPGYYAVVPNAQTPLNMGAYINAVRASEHPSLTVDAYAQAAAIDPYHPALLEAYVDRMVYFHMPELAEYQAQTLVQLRPQNATAWAVLAYVSADRGELAQALRCILAAAIADEEDPFVVSTAGQLFAWYDDPTADRSEVTRELSISLDGLRVALGRQSSFRTAYAEAAAAFAQAPLASATPTVYAGSVSGYEPMPYVPQITVATYETQSSYSYPTYATYYGHWGSEGWWPTVQSAWWGWWNSPVIVVHKTIELEIDLDDDWFFICHRALHRRHLRRHLRRLRDRYDDDHDWHDRDRDDRDWDHDRMAREYHRRTRALVAWRRAKREGRDLARNPYAGLPREDRQRSDAPRLVRIDHGRSNQSPARPSGLRERLSKQQPQVHERREPAADARAPMVEQWQARRSSTAPRTIQGPNVVRSDGSAARMAELQKRLAEQQAQAAERRQQAADARAPMVEQWQARRSRTAPRTIQGPNVVRSDGSAARMAELQKRLAEQQAQAAERRQQAADARAQMTERSQEQRSSANRQMIRGSNAGRPDLSELRARREAQAQQAAERRAALRERIAERREAMQRARDRD